jgi:galactokinase/mevalonate kinase-like predicted kinase
MAAVQEYEIYPSTTLNDGAHVEAAKIQGIQDTLVKAFGGHKHLNHRSEGARHVEGVGLHDEER